MNKVWLVIEIYKNNEPPRIIGAFKRKADADRTAYEPNCATWRNVIPLKVW